MRGRRLAAVVLLSGACAYGVAAWLRDAAPEREKLVATNPPPHHGEPAPAVEPPPARSPEIRRALRHARLWLRDVRRRLEVVALKARGWREFVYEIPEDVAYRDHDFLHEVQAARTRRWFGPDDVELHERAMRSLAETRRHVRLLRADHRFRAGENRLANIALDRRLADLHFRVHRDPPFLHLYASLDPMSPWDLKPADRTPEMLKKLASRRSYADAILRRAATVHRVVHERTWAVLAKPLGLKDLSAPYGGRPEIAPGLRSFTDGVVLVTLSLPGRAEAALLGQRVGWSIARGGGHDPRLGMMVDTTPMEEGRVTRGWAPWYGSCAVHQLLYWYARQRSRWRRPRLDRGFAAIGVPMWLGGVQLGPEGRATWSGVPGSMLHGMKSLAAELRGGTEAYPVLKVRTLLLGLDAPEHVHVPRSGSVRVQFRHRAVLLQQSWALAHFLGRKGSPYKRRFIKFIDLIQHGGSNPRVDAFEEAFRVVDEDDWKELDDAFTRHVRTELIKKLDVAPFLREPPPLSAWSK